MDRRAFLATGATVLFAGCSGNGGEDSTATTGRPADGTDTTRAPATTTARTTTTQRSATAGDQTTSTTAQPTDAETSQPTTTAEAVDTEVPVEVSEAKWRQQGEDVAVTVANGDAQATASVNVTVQWFDEIGRYLGLDTGRLIALGPGKAWLTHVQRTTPIEPSSFKVSAYGTEHPSGVPDGFRFKDVTADAQAVRGLLKNTTSGEREAQIIALRYDDSRIGYRGIAATERIPADTPWRFEIPLQRVTPEFVELNETQLIVL